jgi:hypothetical protein
MEVKLAARISRDREGSMHACMHACMVMPSIVALLSNAQREGGSLETKHMTCLKV